MKQDSANTTRLLQRAIEIAVEGHKGQVDKNGELYILHPLRVMGAFQDDARRIVGILHDIVEDTRYELTDLAEAGFGDEIREAVDAITKRDGEPYDDYLGRIVANDIARDVKLADIGDNSGRLERVSEPDRSRLRKKYATALAILKRK